MFNIRLAAPEDIEHILRIAQRFYTDSPFSPLIPFDEDSAAVVGFQVTEQGYCVLAEVDGEVVGGIGCMVSPFSMNNAFNVATEVFWYVEPEHRGTPGLAQGLIESAEALAKHDGCTLISMASLSTSPEGVDAFYRRRGYAQVEHTYIKGI